MSFKSRGISKKHWLRVDRSILSAKQGGECAYCYEKTNNPTFDHVVPKSKGGLDGRENGVMACRECNSAKGSMSVNQFKKLIKRATISDGLHIYLCHIERHFNLATKRAVRNIYRAVGREV